MAAKKFWKFSNFDENWYTEVFGVTDYEFAISFSKLKIADPRWLPKMFKNALISMKILSNENIITFLSRH